MDAREKELLRAAYTIQDHCYSREKCHEPTVCIFNDLICNEICEIPMDWELPEIEEEERRE